MTKRATLSLSADLIIDMLRATPGFEAALTEAVLDKVAERLLSRFTEPAIARRMEDHYEKLILVEIKARLGQVEETWDGGQKVKLTYLMGGEKERENFEMAIARSVNVLVDRYFEEIMVKDRIDDLMITASARASAKVDQFLQLADASFRTQLAARLDALIAAHEAELLELRRLKASGPSTWEGMELDA
jgi:hypothetical protein